MSRTIQALFLSVVLAHAHAATDTRAAKVDAIDIGALRSALGKEAEVFEIKGGEAAVGLPYLKRIEVSTDAALLTVRNEGKAPLALRIDAEFFNAYGMRLCGVVASFEAEPVPAGGMGARQLALALPNLDGIFAASSITLPVDWKSVRFVAIRTTTQGGQQSAVQLDPKRPRVRSPVVKPQQVRPAIFAENKFGTTNIGNIAVDARWSNYGGYLQRMIETVQVQWERILIEGKTYPPSGGTVAVKFTVDDDGRIARIVEVENHSTDLASRACVSAITDRSPYGPWTEDMKAVLGSQQEITITFYY